jgi:hypothetical protein
MTKAHRRKKYVETLVARAIVARRRKGLLKGTVIVSQVTEMNVGATHLDQDQWKLMISGRKGDANTMKNCLLQWREPN